jgi:hypothetical protein
MKAFLFTLLCVVLASSVARADDLDNARTMLGLVGYPGFRETGESMDALPNDAIPIPLPEGLTILGSVYRSSKGEIVSEIRVYKAPDGSVPDDVSYLRQLSDAGWHAWVPVPIANVFAIPGAMRPARSVCKDDTSTVLVQAEGQYLILRINRFVALCNKLGPILPPAARSYVPLMAPFPLFTAPEGVAFAGSQQAFGARTHLAAVGLTSTHDASVTLAAFAQQMLAAGWASENAPTEGGDSEAFTVRDKGGNEWIAVLTVVPVDSSNTYFFTATAFVRAQTVPNAQAASR